MNILQHKKLLKFIEKSASVIFNTRSNLMYLIKDFRTLDITNEDDNDLRWHEKWILAARGGCVDENQSSSVDGSSDSIPFESDIYKVEMESGAYRSYSRSNGVRTKHFTTTRYNCSWTIGNNCSSGAYIQAKLRNVRSKNCVSCQCASLAVGSIDHQQIYPFEMHANTSDLDGSVEWKTKLCGANISTDSKLLVRLPSSMVLNLDFDRSKLSRFSIEFSIQCKLSHLEHLYLLPTLLLLNIKLQLSIYRRSRILMLR